MENSSLKQNDFELLVNKFLVDFETHFSGYKEKDKHTLIYHRYSSFDFCYNYFYSKKDNPKELLVDIEKSCLVLGFYLASWGMYRASAFLFSRSLKQLEDTIKHIASLNESYWAIDVYNYLDNGNINKLIELYNNIEKVLIPKKVDKTTSHAELTLITKIIMGVFGSVPAFDSYCIKAFKKIAGNKYKISTIKLNEDSLVLLRDLYFDNKDIINELKIYTYNFESGQQTELKYPKAKIIDMFGFEKGAELIEEESIIKLRNKIS